MFEQAVAVVLASGSIGYNRREGIHKNFFCLWGHFEEPYIFFLHNVIFLIIPYYHCIIVHYLIIAVHPMLPG